MATESTDVIVVDDHDVYRNILKKIISTVDHCRIVAEADSGIDAVNTVIRVPADLIAIDMRLPEMNGIDAIREIRKVSPIKILVVSAMDDKDKIGEAMNAGADGFFRKDLGIKTLEKAILETLDGKKPVYTQAA